jgi:hypothetical protein
VGASNENTRGDSRGISKGIFKSQITQIISEDENLFVDFLALIVRGDRSQTLRRRRQGVQYGGEFSLGVFARASLESRVLL